MDMFTNKNPTCIVDQDMVEAFFVDAPFTLWALVLLRPPTTRFAFFPGCKMRHCLVVLIAWEQTHMVCSACAGCLKSVTVFLLNRSVCFAFTFQCSSPSILTADFEGNIDLVWTQEIDEEQSLATLLLQRAESWGRGQWENTFKRSQSLKEWLHKCLEWSFRCSSYWPKPRAVAFKDGLKWALVLET